MVSKRLLKIHAEPLNGRLVISLRFLLLAGTSFFSSLFLSRRTCTYSSFIHQTLTMSFRSASTSLLLLVLALSSPTPSAVKTWERTCRTGAVRTPHQNSLFQLGFPNDENVEALCEGTVTVQDNGEICMNGRVSYAQLAESLGGKQIRAPAAVSISVTGHLVTGTPNVVLGSEARYLYDYVTSYTCGGMPYVADAQITDRLMTGDCGLIESVCLDASFAQDESFYSISHDWWSPKKAQEEKYTNANVIHISGYSIITEYHAKSDKPDLLGTLTQTLVSFATTLVPGVVFNYLPLLGASGIFRYFVWGSVSTVKAPQPIPAPDVVVEDYQIDTAWTTLMSAMRDGLFTEDLLPPYFGVLVKKVKATTASNGCWKEDTAAIDFQAPENYGSKLDAYVNNIVYPALKVHGDLTLHMGKRLAPGTDIVKEAFSTYGNKCGVLLDKNPSPCYHPACTRSSSGLLATNFVYPPGIFQPSRKK
jgi:hypothetical protein